MLQYLSFKNSLVYCGQDSGRPKRWMSGTGAALVLEAYDHPQLEVLVQCEGTALATR